MAVSYYPNLSHLHPETPVVSADFFGGIMDQFYIVLNQIGIFLILIVVGIITVKCGILDERSLGNVSKLVMRVALPAYIFINTVEGSTRQGLFNSLMMIPLTAIMYLLLMALSMLLVKMFRLKGNRKNVFRAVATFGNVGFMGIPLVVELYPDTALIYISLFTILDQCLFWTYGVSLTYPADREKQKFSLKGLKNLLSPALVAILLGTVLVLLGVHLPGVVTSALSKLGTASMPLSLIYVGGMLSMTDIRKVLRCYELYAEIFLKMLVLPVLYFLMMRFAGIAPDMAGTVTFLTALPAISTVPMLSKNNGSDGEYAICAVMLTTLASLITLPLVSLGISLLG